MNSVDDVAKSKLAQWEDHFSNGLAKYPYRYKEWFLLEQLRSITQLMTDKLFQYAHLFPKTHELLHNCRKYIKSDFQEVFPNATQKTINELSQIAFKLKWNPNNNLAMSFISLSTRFTASNSVCSYYKDAEKAFKACASIIEIYGIESRESKKALDIAAHIHGKADMTSSLAIDQLLIFAENKNATPQKVKENFLLNLIKQNESDSFELKESLSFDVENELKENKSKIENSALKAISSFLNANGGTLLIGVSDERVIKGLSRDIDIFYNNSYDKLILHWQNILFSRLGQQTKIFVNSELIILEEKTIICAECKPANKPTYLQGKFFIRHYARCEELKNEELAYYLKNHFIN